MNKQFFFLSPVEVVKVTARDLDEIAEWCGGRVAETESRRVKGRMDKYVWVPTPKGSSISWAFPGMFITKRLVVTVKGELKATWAVFNKNYFEKNYFNTPNEAVELTWDVEEKQRNAEKAAKQINKAVKTPAQFLSDHERRREIKINVGEAAQPGEPVSQPTLSTAEAEAMDAESRERMEQVNREILGKSQPQQSIEHEAVVEADAQPEIVVDPVGQATIVEVETPVMAYVHDHPHDTHCVDSGSCVERGDFRFKDGIHVFEDVAIEASEKGFEIIDMPAAYSEIKS